MITWFARTLLSHFVVAPLASGLAEKLPQDLVPPVVTDFGALSATDRCPGPITETGCWAYGRRKFFVLADVAAEAGGKTA
jgi:hypothetical protein